MDAIAEKIFRYKNVILSKLSGCGFTNRDGQYVFERTIADEQMRMTVTIDVQGAIETQVIDCETGDPYTLFTVEGAEGAFVGKVRADYEEILTHIADTCCERKVFKETNTCALIRCVREMFGDELEFLWDKSPDCAIWRRKDNRKWYAIILTVPYRKLGIDSEGNAEIIDMRMDPAVLEKVVDNVTYFRGYHMNKQHWVTMLLDGSADISEICRRLDDSYNLALK